MPLILKIHKKPVYKSKTVGYRPVPHFTTGIVVISHKFLDEITSNETFCEALKSGNVEVIENSYRVPTIKEVLGAILNIDKRTISMADKISDLMWPGNKEVKNLYDDFDHQIATAFDVSYGACTSMAVKAMTVRELHQLIEERSNQPMEVED